jgi:hypothetical protein
VPVEGQALRVRTALRRRDKAFLGALATAAVVASGVEAYVHWSRDGSAATRCITVTIPSTMGGATIHRCGAGAVRFCRDAAPTDPTVAAACRRQGFGV